MMVEILRREERAAVVCDAQGLPYANLAELVGALGSEVLPGVDLHLTRFDGGWFNDRRRSVVVIPVVMRTTEWRKILQRISWDAWFMYCGALTLGALLQESGGALWLARSFLDALSILIITMPIVYPLILSLGYDPIWFGILITFSIEMALVTPPYGLNLFVIQAVVPDLKIGDLYRGVSWFILVDLIRLAVLIAFPAVALWLPSMMWN